MAWITLVNSSAVAEPCDSLFVVGLARNPMMRVLPSGCICPRADPTDLFEPSQITAKGQSSKLSKRGYARTVSLANVCFMSANDFYCSGPYLKFTYGHSSSRRGRVNSAYRGEKTNIIYGTEIRTDLFNILRHWPIIYDLSSGVADPNPGFVKLETDIELILRIAESFFR
jgi:hypothetical protein